MDKLVQISLEVRRPEIDKQVKSTPGNDRALWQVRDFWRRLCDTRKIYECASFLSTSTRIEASNRIRSGASSTCAKGPPTSSPMRIDFPPVPCQVRFLCDPRYRDICVRVLAEEVGHSDFSGVIGGDVPFYPDPSQRVLALLIYMKEDALGKAQGICVVRSETPPPAR